MTLLCPECRQNPLPPPFNGFRALRCWQCGIRWAEEHCGVVFVRKEAA